MAVPDAAISMVFAGRNRPIMLLIISSTDNNVYGSLLSFCPAMCDVSVFGLANKMLLLLLLLLLLMMMMMMMMMMI